MTIPNTAEEVNNQAAEDLALKMKLEGKFARDIRSLFRRIGTDFAGSYVRDFRTLDLDVYKDDLSALLRMNYRRIGDKFGFNLLKEVDDDGKSWVPYVVKDDIYYETIIKNRKLFEHLLKIDNQKQITNDEREMLIDSELAVEIRALAEQESQLIIDTTKRNLDQDVNDVVAEAAIAGIFLTPVETAEKARKKFIKRGNARSEVIAETETETMAELSKQTEIDVLVATGATIGGALIQTSFTKEWVAVLDNRTRESHMLADGQNVPLQEKFLVQGELLKHPGDPSASASNRINCRCSSVTRKDAR